MLSHGFSPCAGRRASCCGRCLAVAWLFPHLDLSLRAIGSLGLAAAICRTLVVVAVQRRGSAPSAIFGVALAADAVLLTGLLDITGGPFNPFIVMYAVYIWVAVVGTSPVWATVVSAASVAGFGWLVVDHLQAGLIEHHRLNDFPTHLLTMWFSGAGIAELVAHYVGRARIVLGQRQTASRRGSRAGGPERAPGVLDDARGGRGSRTVNPAGNDRCGSARAGAERHSCCRGLPDWSGTQRRRAVDPIGTGSLSVDSRRDERARRDGGVSCPGTDVTSLDRASGSGTAIC